MIRHIRLIAFYMLIALFGFALVLPVSSLSVYAQDDTVAPDSMEKKVDEKTADEDSASTPAPEAVENPYMDKIRVVAMKLSKALDKEQVDTLQALRMDFGMVRSVRLVMNDVGAAAKACAKEIPESGEQVLERHDAWETALTSTLDKSEAMIKAFIKSDFFGDQAKTVREYFDLTDKAAEHADKNLRKHLVTNEETCRVLGESFEKTQEQITGLLAAIEWPKSSNEEEAATDDKEESGPEDAPEETSAE